MRVFDVSLKEQGYPVLGGYLSAIISDSVHDVTPKTWRRPAVIVVPGGGYASVSVREGEPIATRFVSRGFQAFVLKYLVKDDGVSYPEQLLELASAVDYVKTHAEENFVNPDEIFVIGFSAGGHLTANLAVEWQDVPEKAGVQLRCQPTAVALSYPVISAKANAHSASFQNLLTGYTAEAKTLLFNELSVDERVNEKTPPTFLWTTAEDQVVPAQNTLLMALALAEKKIPYEVHVYPNGRHGASTCDYEINDEESFLRKNERWMDECIAFFRLYAGEKY